MKGVHQHLLRAIKQRHPGIKDEEAQHKVNSILSIAHKRTTVRREVQK